MGILIKTFLFLSFLFITSCSNSFFPKFYSEIIGMPIDDKNTTGCEISRNCQGLGVSGPYKLIKYPAIKYSETIYILEFTQDFKKLKNKIKLTRYIDYNIDFSYSTIIFSEAIPIRNDNSSYAILVEYMK